MHSSILFHPPRRPLACLSLALVLAFGTCGSSAWGQQTDARQITFDISAGPLDEVLLDISRQSGVPISFSQDLVQGKRSPAIRGALGGQQAVDKALQGSGLEAQHSEQGLTIRNAPASAKARAITLRLPPIKRRRLDGAFRLCSRLSRDRLRKAWLRSA
ncbi:STN domain-containing protein, partial [Pseudomonas chlororaphis]|uniref:STN domain-containing protein n=1 Tax=Pseudomonas chlororaphis TaxID=587753 RepID=UPI001FF0AE4F